MTGRETSTADDGVRSMADAVGALVHRALTDRAWLLLPALLWWVTLNSAAFAHGRTQIIDGMTYGAFAAAFGFVLRHASVTQRVVSAVLCVATFLTLPGLTVEGHEWEFLGLLGVPAGVAALPRLSWRWLSLTFCGLGVVAILFASGGELTIEDGPTATRLPWIGAVLVVSAILIAARTRSAWVTGFVLVAPPVALWWEAGWHEAWGNHPSLALAYLVGLAARPRTSGAHDVAAPFVDRLHRRLPLWGLAGGFALGWLVVPLDLGQGTGALIVDDYRRLLSPGLAVITATLGLSCVTLPLVASQRGSAFDRLAVPPLVVIGLVAGLFADPGSFRWATGGWGQEAITLTLRMLLVMLAPCVVGVGLAFLTRRAGAILLATLVGASIWAALDGRVHHPADTLLWIGLGLTVGWAGATRASRTVLTALVPAAVLLAMLTLSNGTLEEGLWSGLDSPAGTADDESVPTWFHVRSLLEQPFLALAGGVFLADAIRLARTVFTSCPIPAWHPVRSDFDDASPATAR